jgi:hypothetical protein
MKDLLQLVGYLIAWVAIPVVGGVALSGLLRRWLTEGVVRLFVLVFCPTLAVLAYLLLSKDSPPGAAIIIAVIYLLPIALGVFLLDTISGHNPPTRRDILVSAMSAGLAAVLVAPVIWVWGCGFGWTECP